MKWYKDKVPDQDEVVKGQGSFSGSTGTRFLIKIRWQKDRVPDQNQTVWGQRSCLTPGSTSTRFLIKIRRYKDRNPDQYQVVPGQGYYLMTTRSSTSGGTKSKFVINRRRYYTWVLLNVRCGKDRVLNQDQLVPCNFPAKFQTVKGTGPVSKLVTCWKKSIVVQEKVTRWG